MNSSQEIQKVDRSLPPKKINKLSELVSGKIINDSSLDLKGEVKENVVIYYPALQTNDTKGKSVWLMTTEAFSRNIQLFEIRKKIGRLGYFISANVITEKDVISTLYENATHDEFGQSNVNEENKGELHDYFEEMLIYALKESVSDIHIEKRSTRSIIKMRKHGQLIEYKELSNNFADRFSRVLYQVFAEEQDLTFRAEDIYQSASVNTSIDGVDIKLRYQSLPAYPGGYDVVLRVLPIGTDEESITPLEKLGYSSSQVNMLIDIAAKPYGAMVIAGTTGSGKSTTLKNLLMYINSSRNFRCKIYTIEDPPEYKIPKVSQIPVIRRESDDPNISPFLEPLKATMRGDPDILMIGEIRDSFTGDGLKKATQSGHQVLTTVHATSALGIVDRLADFGITPSVMGSGEFLNGLIYQKLVPVLCPNCSISFQEIIQSARASRKDIELSKRLEKVASLENHKIKVRGRGCSECKGMGIVDRTVCAEIIAPDFTMLELFKQQKSMEAKYYWFSLSDRDPDSDDMTGKPVLDHALLKMRKGLCSPYDLEELFGPLDGSLKIWEQMENMKVNNNINIS